MRKVILVSLAILYLPEIAHQHYIALFRAARESEPLAIARPIERKNSIRLEVCQLPGGAAVDRLDPDVRDSAAIDYIS